MRAYRHELEASMPTSKREGTASPTYGPPGSPTHSVRSQPIDLRKHMEATYFALRTGLAVIAIGYPILLVALAIFSSPPLQPSISEYYLLGGRMRDVLVGVLVAVGACLYLYKGFSDAENYALNLAGIFVAGVAWFPTGQCVVLCGKVSEHGIFAVLFFLCIGYVCVFRAKDTLRLPTWHKDGRVEARTEQRIAAYTNAYRLLGAAMVVSPLVAVAFDWVRSSGGQPPARTFWIEAFGVWVFGAFWALKSYELRQTRADEMTLRGRTARVKREKAHRPDDAAVVLEPAPREVDG
jgi:hypothetical protein